MLSWLQGFCWPARPRRTARPLALALTLLGAAAVFGTGGFGIVGALASIAFSRASLPWALSAVVAQILWIVRSAQ